MQVTKFAMRTWSNDEILRSTNSNSIVMDLLLVGDTYGCDGDSSIYDRRRSQIILSQKQYKDRLYESYLEGAAHFVQTHPVYEVKYYKFMIYFGPHYVYQAMIIILQEYHKFEQGSILGYTRG